MNKLSIIVCTQNRDVYLHQCLLSILGQSHMSLHFEILIIDNASTDNTISIVANYPIHYYHEQIVGLSHARNRGAKEAKGEWLCYIDDDAKLYPNYLERALWVIDNYDFDCFGGMYYAWYPFKKPKWIDESFGTKIPLRETIGEIITPELSGGNFIIRREVLERAGGFPSNFGMVGSNIGYGEEDYLQRKLLKMGYILGFDPELKIDHAVLPHKLKLSWHLKSWYAHGRDGQRFTKEYSFNQIIFLFFRSLAGAFLKLLVCFSKLIMKRNYYWQNLVWDVVSPVFYRVGQLKGQFSK